MRNANQDNKFPKTNATMATSDPFGSEKSGGLERAIPFTRSLPMNFGIRSKVNTKEVSIKGSCTEDLFRNYGCSS